MTSSILSNTINNQVMILDLENRILEVNEKVIVDTGLSSEELIGKSCLVVVEKAGGEIDSYF